MAIWFRKRRVALMVALVVTIAGALPAYLLIRTGLLRASSRITEDGVFIITPGQASVRGAAEELSELRFSIRNRTGAELVVDRVASSCGCTVVQSVSNRHISSGGKTELVVQARIPPHGQRQTRVSIYANERRYEIPITLNGPPEPVPRFLTFPDKLELRDFVSHHVVSRQIEWTTVERAGTLPWIAGAASSDSRLRAFVTLRSESRLDDIAVRRTYQANVEADVPSLDSPITSAFLSPAFSTEDARVPGRSCLVTVRALPIARLVPSEIVFRIGTVTEQSEKTVLLIQEEEFESGFTIADVDAACFHAELLGDDRDRVRQLRVRMVQPPELIAGQHGKFEIKLRGDDPEIGTLHLPLLVLQQ